MSRARKSSSKGFRARLGGDVEEPRASKKPAGDQGVEVGVEVQVFTEGVDGHDDARHALGHARRRAQELHQALVGDAAEILLSSSRSKRKQGRSILGMANTKWRCATG